MNTRMTIKMGLLAAVGIGFIAFTGNTAMADEHGRFDRDRVEFCGDWRHDDFRHGDFRHDRWGEFRHVPTPVYVPVRPVCPPPVCTPVVCPPPIRPICPPPVYTPVRPVYGGVTVNIATPVVSTSVVVNW